ncbi:MAG: tail fiber protein [bacterium]|nr:tail fiber protein [bacterium]
MQGTDGEISVTIASLETKLTQERTDALNALHTTINSEQTSAHNTLHSTITSEQTSAHNSLHTTITSEQTSAHNSLHTTITSEQTGAHNTLQSSIAGTRATDISIAITNLDDDFEKAAPAGTIVPFGGGSIPDGWLLCDGSSRSRTTYSNLFQAIGTAWGTANGSGFNLPDLRGHFLRGVSNGTGRDPNAGTRFPLYAGGYGGDNVGSYQDDAFQGHHHTLTGTIRSATYIGNNSYKNMETSGKAYGSSSVTNPISDGVNGTPSTSSETRPMNAGVHYIIKY